MFKHLLQRSYKTLPTPSPSTLSKPYASSLSSLPKTILKTLPNGFRIATETTLDKTCTVGLYINAGSRFETEETNGVAHFLEHLSFKGTSKRSQAMLERGIEDIGGHLNAYTSREQTVYYGKCLVKDFEEVTGVLADMVMGSTLDAGGCEQPTMKWLVASGKINFRV
jgi:mitochondrial-processing peptidase subunit beta